MLASAMAMYGGESISFETNFTNPVYTVVGNSSDLTGLNITFENGNITISPAINFKPDNFTLIFFDNITNEIIKEIHHGGGGGGSTRTRYIDDNIIVYVPEHINQTNPESDDICLNDVCGIDNYPQVKGNISDFQIFLLAVLSLLLLIASIFILLIIIKRRKKHKL